MPLIHCYWPLFVLIKTLNAFFDPKGQVGFFQGFGIKAEQISLVEGISDRQCVSLSPSLFFDFKEDFSTCAISLGIGKRF